MVATLETIEKLIVDGQKEVLGRLDSVEKRLDAKIDSVEERLNAKIDSVEKKLDAKIDGHIYMLYDLIKDTQKDIQRVEHKLDEHMRAPVHA